MLKSSAATSLQSSSDLGLTVKRLDARHPLWLDGCHKTRNCLLFCLLALNHVHYMSLTDVKTVLDASLLLFASPCASPAPPAPWGSPLVILVSALALNTPCFVYPDLARQYKLMQSQLMAKIIELQERERVLQDQLGAKRNDCPKKQKPPIIILTCL